MYKIALGEHILNATILKLQYKVKTYYKYTVYSLSVLRKLKLRRTKAFLAY